MKENRSLDTNSFIDIYFLLIFSGTKVWKYCSLSALKDKFNGIHVIFPPHLYSGIFFCVIESGATDSGDFILRISVFVCVYKSYLWFEGKEKSGKVIINVWIKDKFIF